MVGRAMMSMDATQPGDDAKSRRLLGEYSLEVKNESDRCRNHHSVDSLTNKGG